MTRSRFFRISGICLVAGCLAFALHVVLRSVITAGPEPVAFAKHGAWIPVQLLGAIGAALVLLGLPGMYARVAVASGLLGLMGMALLATAWMFVALFISLYSALVVPWLADRAPSLIAASAPPPAAFVIAVAVGLVAWCVGAVLLAIPFLRRRARPRWVGYALVASAVWMIVGNLLIAPSGPASNLAVNLLSNLGPVLLLAGVARIGHGLAREPASTA